MIGELSRYPTKSCFSSEGRERIHDQSAGRCTSLEHNDGKDLCC